MRAPSSCRLRVEGLESREMLSGAGAVLPYTELTLKGRFSPGAATTVTFAAKGFAPVTVTPSVVAKGSIVVAVPAFFSPTTGQPSAATASVSVAQGGGASKAKVALKGLRVASLPETGLPAGDVAGAVSTLAAATTETAADNFENIAANDPTGGPGVGSGLKGQINLAGAQVASRAVADLGGIGSLIPAAQQALVALASGAVGSVPLGTFGGSPATIDSTALGLGDRIVASGVDGATGTTSTGTALIQALDGAVAADIAAGPAATIRQAMGVVDILSTATGPAVVPPGVLVSGLAAGAITAVVAAAEAETQILQGAFTPGSTLGPADLAMIDRVLDDPALGLAFREITANFTPQGAAGIDLLDAVDLAEDLAVQIDPAVPGSAGARFAAFLSTVPLHGT